MLPTEIPNYHGEIEALNVIGTAGIVMMIGFSFEGTEFFYSSYPETWLEIYKKNGYFGVDPVLAWALSSSGVKRWSEIDLPDIRNVMVNAKQFDLNYGAIVSIRSGHLKSFLGVARPDRELKDTELAFIEAKFSTWVPTLLRIPQLTPAELDVLVCLKNGLAQREIAQSLNISESTVKQRAIKACAKLNAKTRTQAVAIAVARNFIS